MKSKSQSQIKQKQQKIVKTVPQRQSKRNIKEDKAEEQPHNLRKIHETEEEYKQQLDIILPQKKRGIQKIAKDAVKTHRKISQQSNESQTSTRKASLKSQEEGKMHVVTMDMPKEMSENFTIAIKQLKKNATYDKIMNFFKKQFTNIDNFLINNTLKELERQGKISFLDELYSINEDFNIKMDLKVKQPDKQKLRTHEEQYPASIKMNIEIEATQLPDDTSKYMA